MDLQKQKEAIARNMESKRKALEKANSIDSAVGKRRVLRNPGESQAAWNRYKSATHATINHRNQLDEQLGGQR